MLVGDIDPESYPRKPYEKPTVTRAAPSAEDAYWQQRLAEVTAERDEALARADARGKALKSVLSRCCIIGPSAAYPFWWVGENWRREYPPLRPDADGDPQYAELAAIVGVDPALLRDAATGIGGDAT